MNESLHTVVHIIRGCRTLHHAFLLQCHIAALKSYIDFDGATFMSMLLALKRAGKWRVAEASLWCSLSIPPFRQVVDELVLPFDESYAILRCLRDLCRRRSMHLPSSHSISGMSAVEAKWWSSRENLPTDVGSNPESPGRSELSLQRTTSTHISADPACACCNSLLLMYKEASPVQAPRSLFLLLAMSECGPPARVTRQCLPLTQPDSFSCSCTHAHAAHAPSYRAHHKFDSASSLNETMGAKPRGASMR
eukprot:jgi/Ulvmu1/10537/UM064_0075.1